MQFASRDRGTLLVAVHSSVKIIRTGNPPGYGTSPSSKSNIMGYLVPMSASRAMYSPPFGMFPVVHVPGLRYPFLAATAALTKVPCLCGAFRPR